MTENLSRFSLRYYTQPQLPGGLYVATCDDVGLGQSTSGTPMLVMSWSLNGSNDHKYLWRVPLVDNDIHKLAQVHRALELPTPNLPNIRAGEDVLDKDNYLGNTAMVYLKPEWYQSQRRSVITEIRHLKSAWAFKAVDKPKPTMEKTVEADAKAAGL